MSTISTIRICTRSTEASEISDIPGCFGIAKNSKRNNLGYPEIGYTVYHDGKPLWHVESLHLAMSNIAKMLTANAQKADD